METGRGQGGSTRRADLKSAKEVSQREEIQSEVALYDPIGKGLENWIKVKDYRFDDFWIEILAHQGKRETGGKWSRPDLALIGLTNYPYLPGKVIDVMTFEVKVAEAVDVSAVYEALAHRRAATRSYVVIALPSDKREDFQDALLLVREEAGRHGIGVIEFSKASDIETWTETVEAVRVDADPQKINQFITVQFSEAKKTQINKRAKS